MRDVGRGIGYDQRIGTNFLSPGIGYGGSCFPKDVRALEQLAVAHDYPAPLLHAVELVNRRQVERTAGKVERALGNLRGRVVTLLGLSFKPNTDDILTLLRSGSRKCFSTGAREYAHMTPSRLRRRRENFRVMRLRSTMTSTMRSKVPTRWSSRPSGTSTERSTSFAAPSW